MKEILSERLQKHLAEAAELRQWAGLHIPQLLDTAERVARSLEDGGKLLLCGNGGSAADSQHLAAEFVVRLNGSLERPGLPALALTTDTSILTAAGNDFGFDHVFSRQVEALGCPGDVLLAISTSGNSANIIEAVNVARTRNIRVIGFLGGDGGRLLKLADNSFMVPSTSTERVQEVHIMLGHWLCESVQELIYRRPPYIPDRTVQPLQ